MKATVKEDGVLIPKRLLKGVTHVEIRKEQGCLVIAPLPSPEDPIFDLGSAPGHSGLTDLAARHDDYLYGNEA